MSLELKVKRLHPDAKLPRYAHKGDAGMDVVAVSKTESEDYIEYGTGLALEVPEGYVCLILPRSSITKKDLMLKNCVGVLDSSYRGELKLRFQKLGDKVYEVGEKIGQILIIKYPFIRVKEVNELSETSRGDGGFGSTGS
jgi:dUTP pyrophosphatase